MNDYYDIRLKEERLRYLKNLGKNFNFFKLDISDKEGLKRYIEKYYDQIEHIVNLAGQFGVRDSTVNPFIYIKSNILGQVSLLDMANSAGVQGMFSLLGTAWLSSTFVACNKEVLLQFIKQYLSVPWQFSIMLLLMSALMGSSAATIKALFPLGLALGISPKILLASVAAVNGIFIIPIYPTILAAINLDTTGSTRNSYGKFSCYA